MELKDFCEICVNRPECGIDNETCRLCANAWLGKGAPPNYVAKQLTLRSALEVNERLSQAHAKEALQAKLEDVSIEAYKAYTKDSLSHRIKLLNNIIAYAEAELNHIHKYEGTK